MAVGFQKIFSKISENVNLSEKGSNYYGKKTLTKRPKNSKMMKLLYLDICYN
jgi:hypothetical protein